MAFRQVLLLDRNGVALAGVDVEAYDPSTQRIIQGERTDLSGRATFSQAGPFGIANFRPRITREGRQVIVLDQGDSERIVAQSDDVKDSEGGREAHPELFFDFKNGEVWEWDLWARLTLPEFTSGGGESASWLYRLDTEGNADGEFLSTVTTATGQSTLLVGGPNNSGYDVDRFIFFGSTFQGAFLSRGILEATADGRFQLYWAVDDANFAGAGFDKATVHTNSWLIARGIQ